MHTHNKTKRAPILAPTSMMWHPAPAQPNQNNQVTQPAEGGDDEKMRISLQISQATLPSHVAIPGRQLHLHPFKANAPRAMPVLQPHEQPQERLQRLAPPGNSRPSKTLSEKRQAAPQPVPQTGHQRARVLHPPCRRQNSSH
ncbi:hypothetical protein XF_2181 [Xylella fastidiosa 9a5c]|uniref:Uncharacterized protein n=1 Tax=Xylella fastidiosa (strain 9a5c) TaxID=160492 RepID=Q9PBG3_XYLFA|nr:hypothetical protein XF_2181 [Xylella fastidiosa 9a5c]